MAMTVLKKWRVTVTLPSGNQVFWISDNFLANVLRTIATLDFSATGLDQPTALSVSEEVVRQPQSSVTQS